MQASTCGLVSHAPAESDGFLPADGAAGRREQHRQHQCLLADAALPSCEEPMALSA
jgi:hypothetical protein